VSLLDGLSKTRESFFSKLKDALTLRKKVDPALLEKLEEVLLSSDVGVEISVDLLDRLKARVKEDRLTDADLVTVALKEEMKTLLGSASASRVAEKTGSPLVLLMVGVNGSGKTTATGKLAHFYRKQGRTVLLAACDTFRAAAIEQLQVWSERAGAGIIMQKTGSDSAAVAFDALSAAKARGVEVLLIDTAGRLHTKSNLMEELRKIKKVLVRKDPGLVIETLLVLDGTNGQNALLQAREFNDVSEINGLVVTKLDGTAKGGAVFSICRQLRIPLAFIGTGEGIEDIEVFDLNQFVEAFFSAK
jgi:fused signal recognition particle receptor